MADIKYQEQADAFQYDLSNLIHRYREEFDLTDYIGQNIRVGINYVSDDKFVLQMYLSNLLLSY